MTVKDSECVKTNSVNTLCLIFNKMNGYFEETNGNKCLTLAPPNESKEKIKKYKELQIKIRDLIRSITKKSDDYDESYIKIKFNLSFNFNDELPLNKMIEIPTMTIVVRAVFHENNKYYPQVFLNECLYKLQIIQMMESTFLIELMFIKQVHQKRVMFFTIGTS